MKNGGSDKPSSSEVTSLPGMYNGVKWPDIYTDNVDGFVPPGPNVATFADDGSPGPTTSSTPATPTIMCRTKKTTNKRSIFGRYLHRRSTHH